MPQLLRALRLRGGLLDALRLRGGGLFVALRFGGGGEASFFFEGARVDLVGRVVGDDLVPVLHLVFRRERVTDGRGVEAGRGWTSLPGARAEASPRGFLQ